MAGSADAIKVGDQVTITDEACQYYTRTQPPTGRPATVAKIMGRTVGVSFAGAGPEEKPRILQLSELGLTPTPPWPHPRPLMASRSLRNDNCTGLAQIARLGPTVWLKIPIRALKLAHNLGQRTIFVR
jgi:hypothetical protein